MVKKKDETIIDEDSDKPESALEGEVLKARKKSADIDHVGESSGLTKTTPQSGLVIGGLTTEDLKAALAVQSEQRTVIKEFVQKHLEDGVDFGRIHVVNRDKCPDQYNCKKDYHYSKPVLFKPGQEKLFSLFQITSKLERDEETYAMLPNITGLVAYKCVMYRGDTIVGEGRGSAVVGDNRRDANATIKIAEKRARMDACLSLGFSEYFAQDLDDPDYKTAADQANERVAAEADARDKDEFGLYPRDPALPIDDAERRKLFEMILATGIQKEGVLAALKSHGIEDPGQMTSGQARSTMKLLAENVFASTEVLAAAEAASRPAVEEAELIVDEDFKSHILDEVRDIGLNELGLSWFIKYVTGKPWGKFETFTDDNWRRAYEVVQDIMAVKIDVEPHLMRTDGPAPRNPAEKAE